MQNDALGLAYRLARTYLNDLDQGSVAATKTVEAMRADLGGPLPEEGALPVEVVEQLAAGTAGGHLGSAGSRFYAWVIGGGLEAALAADWLCSAWDQNAALAPCSPSAAVVEEIAGTWWKELLGLPSEASFAITNGCQMAHFTGLAAARYAVLRDVGWDVNAAGLHGAPRVRIFAGEDRHGSVDRALRFLGFGTDDMVEVPSDPEGRMDPAALEGRLADHSGPKIVVLVAGDLNIAAFDGFSTLIPVAKASGAWVHVDGAFGLFAQASRTYRHLTEGVDQADSWSTDGHKWLNVPYDCGFSCVRDAKAHKAAITIQACYLTGDLAARNPMDWNPEWSRRARGFVVYAAIKQLGKEGVERMVDNGCTQARAIVDGIGALVGAEILWRPTLNQGLLRFLDNKPGATPADHDRKTGEVMARINDSGEAFFSGTTWRGLKAMRVSVVHWDTDAEDVARAVQAASNALLVG